MLYYARGMLNPSAFSLFLGDALNLAVAVDWLGVGCCVMVEEETDMPLQKFLKALGYLSTFDRPPEVDEQIQMHADTLYHRMLDQEAAIEAAKTSGKPIPEFPPLLSSSTPSTSPSTTKKKSSTPPGAAHANLDENKLKPSDLPPEVQAAFKKRLDGLSDEEREVEERAIKAEIQAGEQVAQSLGNIYERQAEEKRLRKEQGKETIGDRVSSIFGFR